MSGLIVVAVVVGGYFIVRRWVRWSTIANDHGRNCDAWGQFFINEPGGPRMYRINNARGEHGSFYAIDLGKDRSGRRVCGWWDLNAERVVFIRPGGGRWLRRDEPPRPLTARELEAMKTQRLGTPRGWLTQCALAGTYLARFQPRRGLSPSSPSSCSHRSGSGEPTLIPMNCLSLQQVSSGQPEVTIKRSSTLRAVRSGLAEERIQTRHAQVAGLPRRSHDPLCKRRVTAAYWPVPWDVAYALVLSV